MGMDRSGSLTPSDWLLRGLQYVVPSDRREDWLREWRAELWHEADRLAKAGVPGSRAALHLFGRSLGCITDAVAMRRFHPVPVEEDLGAALRVVFRSPRAAGIAAFMVGITVAVDTMVLTMSRFADAVPEGMRGLILLLTGLLTLLLPLSACAAAASAVGWSEAGRREEAVRRAIGMPEPRLRRQRALQGMLVAAMGSAAGIMFASKVIGNFQRMLVDGGDLSAAARLANGPTTAELALPVALGMTLLLPFIMSWRRRHPAGARWTTWGPPPTACTAARRTATDSGGGFLLEGMRHLFRGISRRHRLAGEPSPVPVRSTPSDARNAVSGTGFAKALRAKHLPVRQSRRRRRGSQTAARGPGVGPVDGR